MKRGLTCPHPAISCPSLSMCATGARAVLDYRQDNQMHIRRTAAAFAVALAAAAIAVMACTNGGTGASIAGDRAALTTFYHATGGGGRVINRGWLSDKPLEQWYGVATDARGCCDGREVSDDAFQVFDCAAFKQAV